jgi:uncharacterized surface protein with fasciclin (FAS1) repeats
MIRIISSCQSSLHLYINIKPMKLIRILPLLLATALACNSPKQETTAEMAPVQATAGQSAVQDDVSQPNIVQVAVGSPDHKTLVAALKAAEYVDALSNAGPFTVFAPTDEAFGKLPAGTVETLVKPENKLQLQNILEYHVYVGVIRENMIQNDMNLNQVNGKNVKLTKEGDAILVNGAKIIATVPTSNGIIYVIDQVLLPPDK